MGPRREGGYPPSNSTSFWTNEGVVRTGRQGTWIGAEGRGTLLSRFTKTGFQGKQVLLFVQPFPISNHSLPFRTKGLFKLLNLYLYTCIVKNCGNYEKSERKVY